MSSLGRFCKVVTVASPNSKRWKLCKHQGSSFALPIFCRAAPATAGSSAELRFQVLWLVGSRAEGSSWLGSWFQVRLDRLQSLQAELNLCSGALGLGHPLIAEVSYEAPCGRFLVASVRTSGLCCRPASWHEPLGASKVSGQWQSTMRQ